MPSSTGTWTADQLAAVGGATELELASARGDGTLSPYVTIWVVRAGDDLYVRSAYGPGNGWFTRARDRGTGRVRAGGVESGVRFTEVDPASPDLHEAIDTAYHAKYDHYGPKIVGAVVGPRAREVTLRLLPTDLTTLDEEQVMSYTLNNGAVIPAVGYGVFQTPPAETVIAVETALSTGYRHIDTAAAYGNEREVGEGIRRSGLDRSEVFVETKVWISDYGYEQTLHAFEKSSRKLGVEQLDLLILHQALPGEFDRTVQAYRALEKLLSDGRVRAIGVSNFMPEHLARLAETASVVPAVNQIEVHPYFRQSDLLDVNAQHGILTQAWSPIGGITFYRDGAHGSTLEDATIVAIAKLHERTPAQVMLRWHLQQGRQIIPKSVTPERIRENLDVFDFDLTADELAAIDARDTGVRGGPEPEQITLEAFGREIPEA